MEFTTLVGSRLYGIHKEGSDFDFRAVRATPLGDLLLARGTSNEHVKQEEGDLTIYEAHHFVRLLMGGNPTMVEMVYSLRKFDPDRAHFYGLEHLLDSGNMLRSLKGYWKGALAKPAPKQLGAGILYLCLYHHLLGGVEIRDSHLSLVEDIREGLHQDVAKDLLKHEFDLEDEYNKTANQDHAKMLLAHWYHW